MITLTPDYDGNNRTTALKKSHHNSVIVIDEKIKEPVAIGAAAAANCHPCLDHRLAKCDELGIDREQLAATVKVEVMVNRDAENAIRKKLRSLLGEPAMETESLRPSRRPLGGETDD